MDIAWDITPDDLEALEIGANVLGTGVVAIPIPSSSTLANS